MSDTETEKPPEDEVQLHEAQTQASGQDPETKEPDEDGDFTMNQLENDADHQEEDTAGESETAEHKQNVTAGEFESTEQQSGQAEETLDKTEMENQSEEIITYDEDEHVQESSFR